MLGRQGQVAIAAALLAAGAARAADRSSIAVFRDWGAFREGAAQAPDRCFAIAEPPRGTPAAGHGAFASIASWPAERLRGQVAIRLSRAPRADAPVTLTIGDHAFALAIRGRDAWARDRRTDAIIVSAMRSGSSMSVSGVSDKGMPFADGYRLRGAASAIDAAMLACPMR